MNTISFFALDKDFALARHIAEKFNKVLVVPEIVTFADSEIRIDLENINLEGQTAYIIQSMYEPVNQNYMKLFFLADMLKQRGAAKVIALIPYFGYSRQCNGYDSKTIGHASTVAKLLESSGIDQVISCEIHDNMLEKFFTIPFKNIVLRDFVAQHIKSILDTSENWCLVAPDHGAKARVQEIAKLLEIDAFFFSKERTGIDQIDIVGEYGSSCVGKNAIIIDDIINTGNTALKVVDKLVQKGINKIYAYFIHPVISNDAAQKLQKSPVEKIFVTDSVALTQEEKISKIEVLTIANFLFQELA